MHSIIVENHPAITAFQATATKEFEEKTVKRVHVTDGRLTVESGGAASTNTKINYLQISPSDVTAPAAPANLEATAGDSTVGLTWDAVTASDLDGLPRLPLRPSTTVALTEANRLTDEPISDRTFTDNERDQRPRPTTTSSPRSTTRTTNPRLPPPNPRSRPTAPRRRSRRTCRRSPAMPRSR